jgi:hypothetical protein
MASNSDNFEDINPNVPIRTLDSMDQSSDARDEGIGAGGATKIVKTDMSGPGGQPIYQTPEGSWPGTLTPGDKIPSRKDGVSLPVAAAVDPMTFGDPNDTAEDFKDGKAGFNAGKADDQSRYGFTADGN